MNANTATSAADAERVEAVWGDPEAWVAEGLNWTSLPAINRMINRRVTGEPDLRPLDWFFRRVAAERGPLPLARGLVLACGGGQLERELARGGYVREIVAIDLSEGALAAARATAEREGLAGIEYRQGDMNALAVADGPFDIVFGSGAIHHCAALEHLFDAVSRLLVPGGWFYLDDYVGPSQFQWTEAQLAHTNHLLSLLPERLVLTRSGHVRRRFARLPVAEVIAYDPSEAVRSAEIPDVIARHFTIEERRGYGGALLHLVLGHISQNFLDAAEAVYLDRLIEAEDRLMQAGLLPDDFAVIVARPR